MFSNKTCCLLLSFLLVGSTVFAQLGPVSGHTKVAASTKTAHAKSAPTVADAEAFMKKAEDQLQDLGVRASRASWVQENFITDDTEILSAPAPDESTPVVTHGTLHARQLAADEKTQ